MRARKNPSQLNLAGEILLTNDTNQLAEVKFVSAPLLTTKINTVNELNTLTVSSEGIVIPQKKPWPQKTKLLRIPKVMIIMKFSSLVSIPIHQNTVRTIMTGYRNCKIRFEKNRPR